eukprot:6180391-Amphidinium_carterae.1
MHRSVASIAHTPRPSSGDQQYVINARSNCVHHILRMSLSLPPHIWATRCGWAFGRGTFELCSVIPVNAKACVTCLPHLVSSDASEVPDILE